MRMFAVSSLLAVLASSCGADGSTSPDERDAGQEEDAGPGRDGGVLGLDECFADLRAPATGFVEVQSFETEDHTIRIRRARRPGQRSSVGETFPYDLVRFGVETPDGVQCETQSTRFRYEFGHHNWSERWEARTDGVRYVVHEELDITHLGDDPTVDPWDDTVEAYAGDSGAQLFGPRVLVPSACYSLPYDLNPCFRRTRTDAP